MARIFGIRMVTVTSVLAALFDVICVNSSLMNDLLIPYEPYAYTAYTINVNVARYKAVQTNPVMLRIKIARVLCDPEVAR